MSNNNAGVCVQICNIRKVRLRQRVFVDGCCCYHGAVAFVALTQCISFISVTVIIIIRSINSSSCSFSSFSFTYLYFVTCNPTRHSEGNVLLKDISNRPLSLTAATALTCYKCTKQQFIHLLTATFKDLHIKNSKNYKR